ncbi:RidA family protein [Phyllobacterium endophyticum]|nr:RidA family protein [Phyllobacterium endophyticum]MBB3236761.1 enamine deaminase RidA (YjgF/YER057c/UK114 family) [Phyllobacterium endophyticum]
MDTSFTYNGQEIPAYQPPAYGYTSVMVHAGLAWVSGNVPKTGDSDLYPGKVGADVTLDQAKAAAVLAIQNALAALSHTIGGLDNVIQIVKITVFVASAPGFNLQPQVADAATYFLRDVLQERGSHARSAVGVAELPRNSSVEIELVAAVK